MADATIKADDPMTEPSRPRRGLSVVAALAIAVVAGVIAAGATLILVRDDHSALVDATLAAVALVAFGVTAYGLLQAVLAVIDSAGERRRQERIVSERRQGERARQPRTP
jgi:hypothetical protein